MRSIFYIFLYFLRLPIASELQDSNELDVLDLYSSLRPQFSYKKLACPNKLNELSKFTRQRFKNFKTFLANAALPFI